MYLEYCPIDIVYSSSLLCIDRFSAFITEHDFKTIESYEDYTPQKKYSLLILNDDKEGMYSGNVFRSEPNFDAVAYFRPNYNNINDIIACAKSLYHIYRKPGVLNYQQIDALLKLGILIYYGNISCIKGASYDLTLAEEHLHSGIEIQSADEISIDPLDFVVVGANESANMPKNISGTFDLKVSMFCRGIILSNGPQVDPGYRGRLFCLLYNSSSLTFNLHSNRPFSSIVFQTLCASTEKAYSGIYQRKQHLGDYVSPFTDNSTPRTFEKFNLLFQNVSNIEKTLASFSHDNQALKCKTDDFEAKLIAAQEKKSMVYSVIAASISIIISVLLSINYWEIYSRIGKFEEKITSLESENKMLNTILTKMDSQKMKDSPALDTTCLFKKSH